MKTFIENVDRAALYPLRTEYYVKQCL